MTGPTPDAEEALPSQEWEFLLNATTLYATGHINRWFWRGSLDGVLPDGFDPQSIAAQAISDFLHSPRPFTDRLPLTAADIQRDLEKRVRRHVNRLYHRSENRLLRNEADLGFVTLDDGETVPLVETIPAPDASPSETALHRDDEAKLSRFHADFRMFLGSEPQLAQTFETIRNGLHQPRRLAERLGLRIQVVNNLQKRLRRKAAEFSKTHPFPKTTR